MEDKERFVSDFQEALIRNGGGRYDWLMDDPIGYEESDGPWGDGANQYLTQGGRRVMNVTVDSLLAVAKDLCRLIG